jgi:hypothetical protein
VGTRDPGFTTTELADYRATRRIVVRVNGWVMGMDKVPWVGNGWVQLSSPMQDSGVMVPAISFLLHFLPPS